MLASITLGSAGLVLLALGLVILLLLPWRRHPAEIGRTALYHVLCTGELTAKSVIAGITPPLWRVSLYSDFLIIANVRPTRFTYRQIQSAVWMSGRQPSELRLTFARPSMRLTLHPKHPRPIIAVLRTKGIHHGWEPFVDSSQQPVD